jgi:hypothetical protein
MRYDIEGIEDLREEAWIFRIGVWDRAKALAGWMARYCIHVSYCTEHCS